MGYAEQGNDRRSAEGTVFQLGSQQENMWHHEDCTESGRRCQRTHSRRAAPQPNFTPSRHALAFRGRLDSILLVEFALHIYIS